MSSQVDKLSMGKTTPLYFHNSWSKTMTNSLMKGLVLAAVLFLFSGLEASAQLPVRTQNLHLLGATSGYVSMDAQAATTTYTITWPVSSAHDGVAANVVGDQAILVGTYVAADDWDLDWIASDGFVDGNGTIPE